MKPHSLGTIEIGLAPKTLAEIQSARRVAKFKGEVLPETQVVACRRVKVADLPPDHLKPEHIAHLEQNQQIASCCRHPENHEVEARKSHPAEPAPDTYIFYCKCGKKQEFFCCGLTDKRPVWA